MGRLEQELRELIGAEATDRLLQSYTRVYIAEKPEGSKLALAIGLENAQILLDYFGAGHLSLPCGSMRGHEGRAALVMEKLAAGWSVQSVATWVGVSERTVWKYKARLRDQLPAPTPAPDRPTPRQLSLFDDPDASA